MFKNLKKITAYLVAIGLVTTSIIPVKASNVKGMEVEVPSINLDLNKLSVKFDGNQNGDVSYIREPIELTLSEKEELLNNPLFIPALERVQKLQEDGVNVSGITFNMDYNLLSSIPKEYDDPAYWEGVTNYLGSYNGFKFRYIESTLSVESGEIDYKSVSNISEATTWGEIAKSSLVFIAKQYLAGKSSELSTLFKVQSFITSMPSASLNIKYGKGNNGFMKYKAFGNLITRDVWMNDKDNKVYGYAYYHWGYTQLADLTISMNVKVPTSATTYKPYSGIVTRFKKQTPGYNGSVNLYQNLIKCYNSVTSQNYSEDIDVYNTVMKFVLG